MLMACESVVIKLVHLTFNMLLLIVIYLSKFTFVWIDVLGFWMCIPQKYIYELQREVSYNIAQYLNLRPYTVPLSVFLHSVQNTMPCSKNSWCIKYKILTEKKNVFRVEKTTSNIQSKTASLCRNGPDFYI